jgi:hypothetical protein
MFDLGRLNGFVADLREMGVWDSASVVVFSDHGEGRTSYHDATQFSHGASELYGSVIRVPLMVKDPRIAPGMSDRLTSLVDVFPAVLDLAGIVPKEEGRPDGVSVLETDPGFCYSEVFASDKEIHLDDKQDEVVLSNTEDSGSWFLLQRAVTTRDGKLMVVGKQEDFLGDDVIEMEDLEFLKALYRKLLARLEDKEGMDHYLRVLAGSGGSASRKQIYDEFIVSPEYNSRPRIYLYDLLEDSSEDRPVPVGSSVPSLVKGYDLLQRMFAIEAGAVESPTIFDA